MSFSGSFRHFTSLRAYKPQGGRGPQLLAGVWGYLLEYSD